MLGSRSRGSGRVTPSAGEDRTDVAEAEQPVRVSVTTRSFSSPGAGRGEGIRQGAPPGSDLC